MLFIDFDIKDGLVTEPGFSINGSVSTLALTGNGTTNFGCYRTPDGSTLMQQPFQYQDSWPTKPKFGIDDFHLDTTAWEQQDRRAPGDHWLHSLGPVTEPVTTKYIFPRNTGYFIEMWLYTKPDSVQYDLFDMTFGGNFSIYLHSDGTCDLFDVRQVAVALASGEAPAPVASGSISKGQPIASKFLALTILPDREGYILVSSNLGGWFLANVGSTLDPTALYDQSPGSDGLNVITDAGPVSFYNESDAVQAAFSFSVLQYPNVSALQTPDYASRYPIRTEPALIAKTTQEFGTRVALTPNHAYDPDNPPSVYGYTITFTGGNGSQKVQGIPSAGHPALFGNLYTGFDYLNRVNADRGLSATAYSTNTLSKIRSASMRIDKDRNKSTFTFSLDNPNNLWTSLKDYQNRRMRAYLDLPENQGLPADPNDPDRGLIAAAGGPIHIFEGYTETPDFVDGTASYIEFQCVGLVKKMRHFVMSSQKDWDDFAHTQAIREILMLVGHVDISDVSDDFPEPEIYIYDDGVNTPLPGSGSGSEPAWRPADGVSAEEFIGEITDWSGWDLYEASGKWFYVPKDFEIASAIAEFGVPTIWMSNTLLSPLGGVTAQTAPNCDIEFIAALADEPTRQSLQELIATDIGVLGMDDDGDPLFAYYEATSLMTDRTDPFYVGARWSWQLINPSLTTEDAVVSACTLAATSLTKPTRPVENVLPDFRLELPPNAPHHIENYGDALITSINVNFGSPEGGSDRFRRTQYVGELV